MTLTLSSVFQIVNYNSCIKSWLILLNVNVINPYIIVILTIYTSLTFHKQQ